MLFRYINVIIFYIFISILCLNPGWAQELQVFKADPVAKCRNLTENAENMAQFEANCLSSLVGIVEKIDNMIRIKLRDGTTKSFKNSKACTDRDSGKECILYHLRDYFSKSDLVVVDRWLDMGPSAFRTGSYMVDRGTGRVIDLPDNAHFSPDGTRFVALSVCYDHCANRIDIWSIKDGPARLEWRHRIKQGEENSYYYKLLNWQDDGRVNIRIYPESPAEGDAGRGFDDNKYSDASIVIDGSSWKIEKSTQDNVAKTPKKTGRPKN